ncbi:MAG: hypothetical protein WC969_14735 [Elusimicrobiota bacterium]
MKNRTLAALALLLAGCTAGGRPSRPWMPGGAPSVVAQAPAPSVVTAMPVTVGQAAPVIGGHPVMPGSVECHGIAPVSYVPSVARVAEIRMWTDRALRWDVEHGVLVSPLGQAEALRLLGYLPAIRFYDRPHYGWYRYPDGTPRWMCAQGVSADDGPQIAADDPTRTERLVCFETVNWYVGLIGLSKLWDGPYIQATENAVGSQVTGGWKSH